MKQGTLIKVSAFDSEFALSILSKKVYFQQ